MTRQGTIANACAQPNGTSVYLDAVVVDKIKAQDEVVYFVIREPWNFSSRLIVYCQPPQEIRMGETVDIQGEIGTLPNGNQAILNAKVIGYFDSAGDLLVARPILKGYYAPTPWQWKAPLGATTIAGRSMATMGVSSLPPGWEPSPSPLPPAVFYSTIAALKSANPPGTDTGMGVKLDCKRTISIGTDTYGNYTVIGEDGSSDTIKVYHRSSEAITSRVNAVIGQLRTANGSLVIDYDCGPGFDPQGYFGLWETSRLGTVAYARTLSNGSTATVTGLKIIANGQDFPGTLYGQELGRSAGIRIVCAGAEAVARGATVDVSGTVNTAADGERQITAGNLTVTSPTGDIPGPLAINHRRLGGAAFNSRTPGITDPKEVAPDGTLLDPAGLSTIGMFVATWGKVTSVNAANNTMYVDDGSAFANPDGLPVGVKVTWTADGGNFATPAVGSFVCDVIGISSMEAHGAGKYLRLLKLRNIARPTLTAVGSDTNVTLTWTTQDNTSYRLYRSDSAAGPFALIATVKQGAYVDTNVVYGSTYYYRVHSVVAGIEGGPSDPVSTSVGPPPPADSQPPVTTITLSGAQTNGWFTSDVGVTLTAADDSGSVSLTEYDFSDEQWNTYSQPFVITAEGVRTVRARSIDAAHNEETDPATALVQIDKTAPSAGISLAGTQQNGWFTSDVTATVTSSDSGSGLSATRYAVGSGGWTSYTAPVTISQSGVTIIHAQATDIAGLQSTVAQSEVKIDKAAPTASIKATGSQQNGWYRGTVSLELTATDNDGGSGVASIEYDYNDNNWHAYTGAFSVTQSGTTVVRARAKDNAGNTGEAAAKMIMIDNDAPVVAISVSGNPQNGWFNSAVQVTLTGVDNQGGSGVQRLEYDFSDGNWRPYTGVITLADDGIATIRARATDNAFNQSVPVTQEIKIDTTPPVTSIGMTGNLQNEWYAGDATVTLVSDDNGGSGVQAILYDFSDNNWRPYTGAFVVSKEGVSVIRARAVDVANNEEAAVQQEVKVDKTAPTIAIGLTGGLQSGWYNSSVAVSLTASDNTGGSGLQTVEYDFNDGNWKAYNGPFSISDDGIVTVRARCTDNANNQSAMPQQEIRIDKAAPKTVFNLSGTQQGDWYNTDVSVTITTVAEQGGSGISRIEYDYNDNNWKTYSAAIVLSQSGSKVMRSRAVDNAGNTGTPVQQLVKIDKVAPTTTFSLSGDCRHGVYVSDVVVTLKGTDNSDGSGVNKIEYDLNDNNWRVYAAPFTLNENKIMTVRARSTDNAGNVGTIAQQVMSINKSAPISCLKSHFNNKDVDCGEWIWFNSCMSLKRDKDSTSVINIWFLNQTIDFQAGCKKYSLPVPDAMVTFDPKVTVATTTYDTQNQIWVTRLPAVHKPKAFLSGLAYQFPSGLPKGINPVNWSGQFFTDFPNAKVDWKWTAVAYTNFTDTYTALGVKPIGGDDLSDWDNCDHAGVPEYFRQYATDGAKGTRCNPFQGQWSGTGHENPYLW